MPIPLSLLSSSRCGAASGRELPLLRVLEIPNDVRQHYRRVSLVVPSSGLVISTSHPGCPC